MPTLPPTAHGNPNPASARFRNTDIGTVFIEAVFDGITSSIPVSTANRHYNGIMDWVAAGNTIAPST